MARETRKEMVARLRKTPPTKANQPHRDMAILREETTKRIREVNPVFWDGLSDWQKRFLLRQYTVVVVDA